jgi:hypothetical protein
LFYIIFINLDRDLLVQDINFWPPDINIKPKIKYLAHIDIASALSSLYDVIYGTGIPIEAQIRILQR